MDEILKPPVGAEEIAAAAETLRKPAAGASPGPTRRREPGNGPPGASGSGPPRASAPTMLLRKGEAGTHRCLPLEGKVAERSEVG